MVTGLLGCERPGDSSSGGSTVSISIPKASISALSSSRSQTSSRASSNGSGGNFGLSMPTSFSSLNCYYVFVGGPEASLSNSSCVLQSGTTYTFGVLAGPIAAGSTASFQIAAGSNRSIYMGGYMTDGSMSGCPSLDNMESIQSHISPPVFLGSVGGLNLNPNSTVNVSVPVTATLQASNQIQNCSGAIGGGNNNKGPGNGSGPGNNNGNQQSFGGIMYTSGSGADGPLSIAAATTFTTNLGLGGKPFNAMSRISSINQTAGSKSTSATVWSGGGSQWVVGQEVMISLIAAGYNSNDASNSSFVNSLSMKGPDSICGGGWYRGKYIFTHIQNISGDTLTFSDPITSTDPLNSTAINQTLMDGSSNFCDFRVVRVPNLSSLSLGASTSFLKPSAAFDPTVTPATNVGLFVVFRVSGTITGPNGGGAANINADGLGFTNSSIGLSGFSINGGNTLAGSSYLAGAFSSSVSTFGGGGSNFGNAGSDYSASDAGSLSQGVGSWCSPCALEDRAYGGGAGGASATTLGAPGGGIIIIFAHQFVSPSTTWQISANGGTVSSGSGGAGAGGSVFIATNQLNLNMPIPIKAEGGSPAGAGFGGAGGGGSAELAYCINQNGSNLPTFSVIGGNACNAGTTPCTAGGAGNPITSMQSLSACNL